MISTRANEGYEEKVKRHKGGCGCNRDRDGINILFIHSYPPDYHPCSIGANDLTQDGISRFLSIWYL
jgi:hypothetical protein